MDGEAGSHIEQWRRDSEDLRIETPGVNIPWWLQLSGLGTRITKERILGEDKYVDWLERKLASLLGEGVREGRLLRANKRQTAVEDSATSFDDCRRQISLGVDGQDVFDSRRHARSDDNSAAVTCCHSPARWEDSGNCRPEL
ncbi:hypothetical protein C0Q70_17527 [Pomacea canaliculata]|uniref:Uncharacterized protein n=1 Tax=Pomacea canaliculata TaxID=400727 RepID=A0A2T7NKM8_POMCA|nr:hypothetical protein C0Q70_17527 [Pomacea canaliculata]